MEALDQVVSIYTYQRDLTGALVDLYKLSLLMLLLSFSRGLCSFNLVDYDKSY